MLITTSIISWDGVTLKGSLFFVLQDGVTLKRNICFVSRDGWRYLFSRPHPKNVPGRITFFFFVTHPERRKKNPFLASPHPIRRKKRPPFNATPSRKTKKRLIFSVNPSREANVFFVLLGMPLLFQYLIRLKKRTSPLIRL
jgi:hypothetical protein